MPGAETIRAGTSAARAASVTDREACRTRKVASGSSSSTALANATTASLPTEVVTSNQASATSKAAEAKAACGWSGCCRRVRTPVVASSSISRMSKPTHAPFQSVRT